MNTLARLVAPSILLLVSSSVLRADDPPLDLDAVKRVVKETLAGQKGDFPDRLLTRGDVQAVLVKLGQRGWNVPEQKPLVDRFLPDGDTVARILRARKNEPFAKKIAGYPNVYARLDQLRRMPYGTRRIQEFASTPGGHTMLQYMTSTKGGAELSRQLSRGQGGKGFGEATGRLYTKKDLEDELERLHEEQFGTADPAKKPAVGGETR